MTKFRKFPSIEKFSTLLKQLNRFYEVDDLKSVVIAKKIKLHGSNMCVGVEIQPDGTVVDRWAQKRSSVITPQSDCFGFAQWSVGGKNVIDVGNKIEKTEKLQEFIDSNPGENVRIYIFGEWAGNGIQKKVAVSELPKKFYPFFEIYQTENDKCENIIDNSEVDMWPNVFTADAVFDIKPIEVEDVQVVDFSKRETTEAWVAKTELELFEAENVDPFIKRHFRVEGIGEGFVFYITNKSISSNGHIVMFKVKGDKHAKKSSGNKNNLEVDIEKFQEIRHFVNKFVDDARVEQGIHETQINNMKGVSVLLKWMVEDVRKESVEEIAIASFEFDDAIKEINRNTAIKAREYFMGLNN